MNTSTSIRDGQLQKLGDQFSLLAKLLRAKYGASLVCATPVLDKVLLIIGAEQPINIKRLSEVLLVTSAAATQHVTALEDLGAVSRAMAPSDRREIRVQLTRKGRRMCQHTRTNYLQALREIFEGLNESELETFLQLLAKASSKHHVTRAKT